MGGETEHVPPESNIDKTVEVARIVFHVATPLTVVEANGRRSIRPPGTTPPPNDIDTGIMVAALTEALNGMVRDTAGTEFGVAEVQMRASGSIEIIAVVVATYLAVKQGVEVVDVLQKVAGLGRWLVQAVMRAQPMQLDSVHARVDINPAMTAADRTSITSGNASGATSRSATLASSIGARGLLLLAILNLLIAGAVLAVVLTR
jgi:hypothetical protein